MIKVLVVDDSRFFRNRLIEIINDDPELSVAGIGCNGQEAIEQCHTLKPDIILMDVEMPVLDGISAVRAIMQQNPLPILMYSSKTQKGAQATFDALEAGAIDYIAKDIHDPTRSLETLKQNLVSRIKVLAKNKDKNFFKRYLNLGKPRKINLKKSPPKTQLIIIGASTGGPVAVQEIIMNLPADFPVPIVVIQHMPGAFTENYASRLNHLCELQVVQGKDGDKITPGKVLIAPGGTSVTFCFKSLHPALKISQPCSNSPFNPSLDKAFLSAAEYFHENILVIILTGMGDDGLKGVIELKKNNSKIWVQDEESSVIWGMPGKIFQSGYCDQVVSLIDMPQRIMKEVGMI